MGKSMVKPAERVRTLLLICGILAALLNVGTDILAGVLWPGYSFIAQSASELSALGAPTRPFVVLLELMYDVLMITFGVGVWRSAGRNRALRVTACLVIGNVAITVVASAFFPMRLGASATTPGVILGAVSVLCFLLAMGFGAAAFRNWFRFYSIGTLLAYLILAIMRIWVSPQTGEVAPTSLVGIQERTMIYSYMLWVVLLAIVLLRMKERPSSTSA